MCCSAGLIVLNPSIFQHFVDMLSGGCIRVDIERIGDAATEIPPPAACGVNFLIFDALTPEPLKL
jgi:hypothetical protein